METKTIKLRPKQLESLNQIQNQKAQINKMLQDLNTNESLIIELALEEIGVQIPEIANIKLEDGSLVFELKGKEEKAKKTKKNIAS